MTLVDHSSFEERLIRRVPTRFRISPDVVNRLRSRLATETQGQKNFSLGLLFGAMAGDTIAVSAFRSFHAGTGDFSGIESLDWMMRHLRTVSRRDPEVSSLELLGWFCLRTEGGLTKHDADFHNKHFHRASDLALVIRPKRESYVVFEIYSRIDDRQLSSASYCAGSLRVDGNQPLTGAVEISVSPRPKLSEGIEAGAPPGLPALRKEQRRMPWLSSAIIFAIAASATFVLFYIHTAQSGGQSPLVLQALFPSSNLSLHAEGQGDRVLLSWNRRNPVVRTARGGLLRIADGTQRREVHLDPAQVGNGAVLYRPGSDDVMFRLEVYGQQGAILSESMRVLDGDKTHRVEAQNAPTDLGGPNGSNSEQSAKTALPSSAALKTAEPKPLAMDGDRAATVPIVAAGSGNRSTEGPPKSALQSQFEAEPSHGTTFEAASPNDDLTKGSAATQRSGSTSEPSPKTPSALKTDPQGQSAAAGQAANASLSLSTPGDRSPDTNPGGSIGPATTVLATASPQTLNTTAVEPRMAATFVPPRPIHQVLPNVRILGAGAIRTTPQVDVNVKVNKKGRVVEVSVVNTGPGMKKSIADSAANAARQWIFEPATIDGKPVESYHTIVFEFRPESR